MREMNQKIEIEKVIKEIEKEPIKALYFIYSK